MSGPTAAQGGVERIDRLSLDYISLNVRCTVSSASPLFSFALKQNEESIDFSCKTAARGFVRLLSGHSTAAAISISATTAIFDRLSSSVASISLNDLLAAAHRISGHVITGIE